MSQTEQDIPRSTATPAGTTGDDPLSHLHKMSTTAGLGSGDYVAVNGTAVFALILGIASALILLEDYLLVLPVICIAVSVVAWIQINRSNGTQTGKGLIIFALLCALGFGGLTGWKKINDGIKTREDRQAISNVITNFGDAVRDGKFDQAYALTTERFQSRITRDRFDTQMKLVSENPTWGKLRGFKWNGLAEFAMDETTGSMFGVAPVIFDSEKANNTLSDTLPFRKENGVWKIDNIPIMFGTQAQQNQQQQQRAGGGGGAPAAGGGGGAGSPGQ